MARGNTKLAHQGTKGTTFQGNDEGFTVERLRLSRSLSFHRRGLQYSTASFTWPSVIFNAAWWECAIRPLAVFVCWWALLQCFVSHTGHESVSEQGGLHGHALEGSCHWCHLQEGTNDFKRARYLT